MVDPDLSAAMAQAKIEQVQATGADTVLTACQQCVGHGATARGKQSWDQRDGHHRVCAQKHEIIGFRGFS